MLIFKVTESRSGARGIGRLRHGLWLSLSAEQIAIMIMIVLQAIISIGRSAVVGRTLCFGLLRLWLSEIDPCRRRIYSYSTIPYTGTQGRGVAIKPGKQPWSATDARSAFFMKRARRTCLLCMSAIGRVQRTPRLVLGTW